MPRILALLLLPMLSACFDAPPRAMASSAAMATGHAWRYDPAAPHHGHLPVRLQDRISTDPSALAADICAEFAGELEFIASDALQNLQFTCRFEDPDKPFSLDFGSLQLVEGGVATAGPL